MMRPAQKNILWQACTSRALSTWLLIIITVMLTVGTLLPNPAYMLPSDIAGLQARHPLLFEIGARYNQEKLVTGYLFGTIGVFLVVSATLCSIDRLLARRRAVQGADAGDGLFEGGTVSTLHLKGAAAQQVEAFAADWLRRRLPGMSITQPESGMIIAQRGRCGFWGSILFHTGLIMLLVGLVVFHLGGTRGWLSFTEGQGYLLEKSRFTHLEKEPVWGARLPAVQLELLKQYSLFAPHDVNTAIEHVARFRVTDARNGESFTRDVRINEPLRLEGKDFLLMNGGFATRLAITDASGMKVFDSFVNLREESGTKDDFFTDGGRLHVQVRFYPDFAVDRGQPVSKSQQLKNPAAAIVVTQGVVKLFDGIVPLGRNVHVSDYIFSIPDVRRWVSLEVSSEPGIETFFICAFIGMLGLLLRMLDPDEQIAIMVNTEEHGIRVDVSAASRHFSALLSGVVHECMAALAVWQENV